ncbi:MAG: hypothetical protein WCL21_18945, partial [Mariniphaga sp.]
MVGATQATGSVLWTINGATSTCSPLGPLGPIAGTSAEKVVYTCTIPASPVATYSATATYSGDANYYNLPATTAVAVTVAQVTPSVVLSSGGGGSKGGTLTFTAIVNGVPGATAPTSLNGGVTWSVTGTGTASACTTGSTTSGSNTSYTCTITTSTYGSYIVRATYLGDTNYTASASNTVTVGIANATPTIGSVSYSATTLGGSSTLTVVVTGTAAFTPTGAITWLITAPDSTAISCSSPTIVLNSPATYSTTYTCAIPTATAGNYLAAATFPGDTNYNPVTSATTTIPVAKVAPTLTVTGIQSSTTSGEIITYTGTVTGVTGSVAPTGAPTWLVTGPSAASDICASTTGPVTNGVNSIYTCVVPATLAGTYTAVISVGLDTNYLAAGPSSPIFSLSISKITPTVTVNTSSGTATLGTTFTFTATVAGAVGGATPTGTGTWSIVGLTGITCSGPTGPTTSTPTSVVTYSCPVVAISAGTYVPVFTYGGDSNYSPTAPTSGFTTTVAKANPTVGVTAGATPVLGGTITFTATVTGPTNGVSPSAPGTWAITGVTGVRACGTITGPTQSGNIATYHCTVVATRAGSYVASYTFTGDSDYNAVGAVSSPSVPVLVATPTVV